MHLIIHFLKTRTYTFCTYYSKNPVLETVSESNRHLMTLSSFELGLTSPLCPYFEAYFLLFKYCQIENAKYAYGFSFITLYFHTLYHHRLPNLPAQLHQAASIPIIRITKGYGSIQIRRIIINPKAFALILLHKSLIFSPKLWAHRGYGCLN